MIQGNAETSIRLQQWHDGDETGLDALLERHLPWIRVQVRQRLTALLRRKAESGDFVQDAVVQFLRFSPRFTISNDAHFRAILLRVVENALHDKHDWFTAKRRDIAMEKPLPSDSVLSLDPPRRPDHTPSKSAERREQEAWLRLGLELLDPDDREVVVLKDWDGLTFPEIGEQLSISPDAARMRYNRAVSRLADTVGKLRRGKLEEAAQASQA